MFNAKISIIQLLIILLLSIIVYIFIREKLDSRPIKFENYRNEDSFRYEIKKLFPIGSNVDQAIEVLVKSGINYIKILDIKNKPDIQTGVTGAYFDIYCYYYASLLSFSFGKKYTVSFCIDNERRILSVHAVTLGLLEEFWW